MKATAPGTGDNSSSWGRRGNASCAGLDDSRGSFRACRRCAFGGRCGIGRNPGGHAVCATRAAAGRRDSCCRWGARLARQGRALGDNPGNHRSSKHESPGSAEHGSSHTSRSVHGRFRVARDMTRSPGGRRGRFGVAPRDKSDSWLRGWPSGARRDRFGSRRALCVFVRLVSGGTPRRRARGCAADGRCRRGMTCTPDAPSSWLSWPFGCCGSGGTARALPPSSRIGAGGDRPYTRRQQRGTLRRASTAHDNRNRGCCWASGRILSRLVLPCRARGARDGRCRTRKSWAPRDGRCRVARGNCCMNSPRSSRREPDGNCHTRRALSPCSPPS